MLNLGLCRVMAMDTSLGKRSFRRKAWYMVVARTPVTVTTAIPDNPTASERVNTLSTSDAYNTVAKATLVIGNVYAHHASENLNPRKRLTRTTNDT